MPILVALLQASVTSAPPLECRASGASLLGDQARDYRWIARIARNEVSISQAEDAVANRYAGTDRAPREIEYDEGPILSGQLNGGQGATYNFDVTTWDGDRAVIAFGSMELPGTAGSRVQISCYPHNPNPTKTCPDGAIRLASEACPA